MSITHTFLQHRERLYFENPADRHNWQSASHLSNCGLTSTNSESVNKTEWHCRKVRLQGGVFANLAPLTV